MISEKDPQAGRLSLPPANTTHMGRVIALVDPFTGGHHTAYMRIFAETLIGQGYTVWAFVPDKAELNAWVKETHGAWTNGQLVVADYELPAKTFRRLGRYDEAATILYRWRHLRKGIQRLEKQHAQKVDFVFIAWLDSYLAGYLVPFLLDTVFPLRWSGLYFHPRHMRIRPQTLRPVPSPSDVDVALTARKCKNVVIHDEGIRQAFQNRIGRKAIVFPEIADETPPDFDHPIAKEIRSKAGGRLITGAIGLSRHQGLLTLLQVAKEAASEYFFFVFIGELDVSQYEGSVRTEVESFFANLLPNCFVHFGRLQEGREYNSVFAALDVPFLVYENFASASNRLTKAAIFKKYVLAQDNFCVGEDVKKYGLGLTVEPGNVPQCLQALDELAEMKRTHKDTGQCFDRYHSLHSAKQLVAKFGEMMEANAETPAVASS